MRFRPAHKGPSKWVIRKLLIDDPRPEATARQLGRMQEGDMAFATIYLIVVCVDNCGGVEHSPCLHCL